MGFDLYKFYWICLLFIIVLYIRVITFHQYLESDKRGLGVYKYVWLISEYDELYASWLAEDATNAFSRHAERPTEHSMEGRSLYTQRPTEHPTNPVEPHTYSAEDAASLFEDEKDQCETLIFYS